MVGRDAEIAVYILASTLYIGATSQLTVRIQQHRDGLVPGFTRKYGCTRLVWFEMHESMVAALQRERSMKRWNRAWKIDLVEKANPRWDDLYPSLF